MDGTTRWPRDWADHWLAILWDECGDVVVIICCITSIYNMTQLAQLHACTVIVLPYLLLHHVNMGIASIIASILSMLLIIMCCCCSCVKLNKVTSDLVTCLTQYWRISHPGSGCVVLTVRVSRCGSALQPAPDMWQPSARERSVASNPPH